MPFGLEFQDMTLREIVIELYKNQEAEHNEILHLREDTNKELKLLQDKVSAISCPSKRCEDNARAIAQNADDILVLQTQSDTKTDVKRDWWMIAGILITGILGIAGILLSLGGAG